MDLLAFLLYPIFFEEISYKKLLYEHFLLAIKVLPITLIAMIIPYPIFIIEIIICFGVILSVFHIYKKKKILPYLFIIIFCVGTNNFLGMFMFFAVKN
jgi:hypothetical protein